MTAEHASMKTKGRKAQRAALCGESIVGLRSANSTALKSERNSELSCARVLS
jgi:hypothetical protein